MGHGIANRLPQLRPPQPKAQITAGVAQVRRDRAGFPGVSAGETNPGGIREVQGQDGPSLSGADLDQ